MTIKIGNPADFTTNVLPAFDRVIELLCRDNIGDYIIPFRCRLRVDGWFNDATGQRLDAQVVGWRPWEGTHGSPLEQAKPPIPPESKSTKKPTVKLTKRRASSNSNVD